MNSNNIGIYFSHYECLGHFSRVIAISEACKKNFPNGRLFFLQAGLKQHSTKIDELGRVYHIPTPFLSRRNFNSPIDFSKINVSDRAQYCVETIIRENPELFITEFFPLGREESRFELIPALVKAISQGSKFWSVAGYPLLTGTDYQWRKKIIKLYDKIIIFSPSCEKDMIASLLRSEERKRYSDFFAENASKIIFAGYLLPKHPVLRKEKSRKLKIRSPRGAFRVTVVRGGGAYYPQLIAQAIRASDLLGKEYYMTVIAGPSTTLKEWRLFSWLAENKKVKNLNLLNSVGNYEQFIENSDVCVSVASYHTSVILMKHRKKAVILPLQGDGSISLYEQLARAALLKDVIGARVLSIKNLSAQILAKAVRDKAESCESRLPVPEDWFSGEQTLNALLRNV